MGTRGRGRIRSRRARTLVCFAALLAAALPALMGTPRAAAARAAADPTLSERCFEASRGCVSGRFLTYWEGHGGVALNGYPLGPEGFETLEDGRPYLVQYFERARFEYHPENAAPYDILLGQFGRRLHPADAPATSLVTDPTTTYYFPETGHNLSGEFLTYWLKAGRESQFGLPLTEEFTETLEDGNAYQVQYFERARFELHPENADPQYRVLLGQFGRRVLIEMRAAVPPCQAADLTTWTHWNGASGTLGGYIALTNQGSSSCRLTGWPDVRLLDEQGRSLPLQVRQGHFQHLAVDPRIAVVLRPVGSAGFFTYWSNWCGSRSETPTLVVALPEDGGIIRIDPDEASVGARPRCDSPSSISLFAVSPFEEQFTAAFNFVARYYEVVNARDYAVAYALLATSLRQRQSFADFAAGYADTKHIAITFDSFIYFTHMGITDVRVHLTAAQADGTVRRFAGTYGVGLEDGWPKIVEADIRPEP